MLFLQYMYQVNMLAHNASNMALRWSIAFIFDCWKLNSFRNTAQLHLRKVPLLYKALTTSHSVEQ